jgi:TonB family protein
VRADAAASRWQRRLLGACLFAALPSVVTLAAAQDPAAAVQQDATAAFDVPPKALDMSAPEYPEDMAWRGIDGEVVLVLGIDAEGTVSRVEIESGSGSARLDQVAVERARQWRFTPARRDGGGVESRMRVPMNFAIPPQYALDRVTGRARDAFFLRRREGRMPPPPMDAQGLYPGFVEDDLPIGVTSVAEGRRMLERHGFREDDASPGEILEYTLRDEEGLSVWNVLLPGRFPAALVRRRLVGADGKSWYVSTVLCEGEAPHCAALIAFMRKRVPPQEPLPPLPVSPPLQASQVR